MMFFMCTRLAPGSKSRRDGEKRAFYSLKHVYDAFSLEARRMEASVIKRGWIEASGGLRHRSSSEGGLRHRAD